MSLALVCREMAQDNAMQQSGASFLCSVCKQYSRLPKLRSVAGLSESAQVSRLLRDCCIARHCCFTIDSRRVQLYKAKLIPAYDRNMPK